MLSQLFRRMNPWGSCARHPVRTQRNRSVALRVEAFEERLAPAGVDLQIKLTAPGPIRILPAAQVFPLEYTITYANNGDALAADVVLKIPLPANTTFVGPGDWVPDSPENPKFFTFAVPGTVNGPSGPLTKTFTVNVSPFTPSTNPLTPTLGAVILAAGEISYGQDGNGIDEDPSDNTGSAITDVARKPNVAFLVECPEDANKAVLLIHGTVGNDVISVVPKPGNVIEVTLNGAKTPFDLDNVDICHIAAFGMDGNDQIRLNRLLKLPALLDGGNGDDILQGGAHHDILLGQRGRDILYGNGARDLLIGGEDKDRLIGGDSDDILIGGFTRHDNEFAALDQILVAWSSKADYGIRVTRLRNGLHGIPRLSGNDIFDSVFDSLAGSDGFDLFFFSKGDPRPDRKAVETEVRVS